MCEMGVILYGVRFIVRDLCCGGIEMRVRGEGERGSEWVALKGVVDREMGWRWLLELKWRENGESCNDHLLLLRMAFSCIILFVLIVLSVVERREEERKI